MTLIGWIGIISSLFMIASIYFILTFIESLHKKEERVSKQSKLAAISCLAIAVLLPAIVGLFG